MMSARRCALLLVLLGVLDLALGQLDLDEGLDNLRVYRRDRRFISSPARRFFGRAPHCGHPDSCPPHHCRLDDAVVHGYCCGCSMPTDRVPITCPPWLKCPLSPLPLCDDYNWMMDCCC